MDELASVEILELMPLNTDGWTENDIFLWFARRIEQETMRRFADSAQPLKDHIKRAYGTSKAYAQAAGKTAPQVSTYINKRYWVIDGELYGPIKSTMINN